MPLVINKNTMIEGMLITGLKMRTYQKIMDTVNDVDVSVNEQFQKTYNGFYRIRRNEVWREKYYKIFQSQKNNLESFQEILKKLYKETKKVEPSFVSKMMATIDPKYPIWDKYVIAKLGWADLIKTCVTKTPEEKIEIFTDVYDAICDWYTEYLETDEAKECIEVFDANIPTFKDMEPVKKIDFCLWGIRDDNDDEE